MKKSTLVLKVLNKWYCFQKPQYGVSPTAHVLLRTVDYDYCTQHRGLARYDSRPCRSSVPGGFGHHAARFPTSRTSTTRPMGRRRSPGPPPYGQEGAGPHRPPSRQIKGQPKQKRVPIGDPLAFDGANERIRTADPRITSALLYQLSHVGISKGQMRGRTSDDWL